MILLDTNILIHSNLKTSPHYKLVTQRLLDFENSETEMIVCPQVLYEFYVAATRPKDRNGLGIENTDAINQVNKLMELYSFIDDPPSLFSSWLKLIETYSNYGKVAHDSRLIAFMQLHSIQTLYTLNPKDFTRYGNIITLLN